MTSQGFRRNAIAFEPVKKSMTIPTTACLAFSTMMAALFSNVEFSYLFTYLLINLLTYLLTCSKLLSVT